MILPLIDDNHSPEVFVIKQGTTVNYNIGGDCYVKATVIDVHWELGTESYYSLILDDGWRRQTEGEYLTRVELDGSSSVELIEHCNNR
jgi:hypothetical protein